MENPIDKTVFITGITGFTGRHLESFFEQKGFKVFGTTFTKSNGKNHFKCDILNHNLLFSVVSKVQPYYVIHLAAISFVATKDIPKIYETNIQGTLNLIEALERLEKPIRKIIIASSAAVYGNIGSYLSEEMCPKPVNHYGNSKLAMENMTANFFDKMSMVITRPFNYTGIGQEEHFLIPKIVKHFKARKNVIELGNINTYREYNNVKFLSECYYHLAVGDYKSGIVNIASGNTHSVEEILQLMEDISGHKIDVRINPDFIRKNEIKELKGSSIKLMKIVGPIDSNITLRGTLEDMYLGCTV